MKKPIFINTGFPLKIYITFVICNLDYICSNHFEQGWIQQGFSRGVLGEQLSVPL